MRKDLLKKSISGLVLAVCVFSLTACGNKSSDTKKSEDKKTEESSGGEAVNLKDKLDELFTSDEALGLKGKYNTFDEIKDGSLDENLYGTWYRNDGSVSYEFKEDGSQITKSEYGDNDLKYTCIDIDGYKVICTETTLTSYDADGNVTETPAIAYTTYSVDGNVLYIVNVEDNTEELINSSQNAIYAFYKADDNGDYSASISNSEISMDSFEGQWESDEGNIEIKDGTLIAGSDTYELSFDDNKDFVVTKDGESTTYSVVVSISQNYDTEDRSKVTKKYALDLFYEGSDEKDKPNLIDYMQDWNADFGSDYFYYSGNYTLK